MTFNILLRECHISKNATKKFQISKYNNSYQIHLKKKIKQTKTNKISKYDINNLFKRISYT